MEGDTSTFFSVNKSPFPVPVRSKLRTSDFLDASRAVVSLLEMLGKALAPARYDMSGNIEKITQKLNENTVKYEYLEEMLLCEKSEGKFVAIESLMWLRRGLHFILEFFEAIVTDTECREDLSSFVNGAYSKTLEKYHGWVTSNLFRMLSRFVPRRKDLMKCIALGKEIGEDHVLKDMKFFNANLRICISHLVEFYKENCLESERKV